MVLIDNMNGVNHAGRSLSQLVWLCYIDIFFGQFPLTMPLVNFMICPWFLASEFLS